MRAVHRVLLACALLVAAISHHSAALAQPVDTKEQARALFESGLAHFDRGEWSPALADFLRSRELFPTRTATMNAAVCLRKEGRFDEALDLLEDLLRTYSDLAPGERAFAEKEIAELRSSVGTIELSGSEPAASIVIDGRPRGAYPLSAPLRVPSGSRLVRVYKEGFLPFERRIDVAGRQTVSLEARLTPLTVGGRLVVTEASGATLDVLVDGVVVGKTPWEATVAVGTHTVSLRGEGDIGTQPATATVAKDDVTRLGLAAESLDTSLRIVPTPAGALVSVDGVVVGRGIWEGRLRAGGHKIELAADGFLPQAREAVLVKGERTSLAVSLERDVSSGAFRAAHPGRIFAEIDGGPLAFGLAFGGDVRASCTGACTARVPTGVGATLRAGYQFPTGMTLGLDAGFLALSAGTTARATSLQPRGLTSPDAGTTDDALYLHGFLFGPSFGYVLGEGFPFFVVRVGAGAFVGSGGDNRTGNFTMSGGVPYAVDVSESSRAIYLYVAPEARVAATVAPHLEASIGIQLLVMAALERPTWTDVSPVVAGPPGQRSDGLATFGRQTMAGSFIATVAPSLGIRYAF